MDHFCPEALVVGLGNPGPRYALMRHNIGFMVVDRLAEESRSAWRLEKDVRSELAAIERADRQVLLVKPQTYMNSSGAAVAALHQRLEFASCEVLVVLDDVLLDFGRLRFRRKGGDGGHNGLASVLEKMHTEDIPRLRLGVGSPPGENFIDYVLTPFDADEAVEELVEHSCRAIEVYLKEGIDSAMNRFNSC